jgi:MoaA/NifB/PqqE/SkfB family radical SAM enzyme
MSAGRINFDRYATVPVWYHCNSKCSICMLEQHIGLLPTVGLEEFQRIVAEIVNHAEHDCLIVSGAEITTFEPLELYVRFARSLDWFRTIQIQTNGRRLAGKDYARRLVEAGVNEFFISFHGTEPIHDAITGVKGSFREAGRDAGREPAVEHRLQHTERREPAGARGIPGDAAGERDSDLELLSDGAD